MLLGYDPSAADTCAFEILAEAWVEMVIEGLTPINLGVAPITADTRVLHCTSSQDDVVGVMVWNEAPGKITVPMLYTEPSSRRRGVARLLMADFVSRTSKRSALIEFLVPSGQDIPVSIINEAIRGKHSAKYTIRTVNV